MTVSQREGGYAPPEGFAFAEGDTCFYRFQISGYKPSDADQPKVQLAYEVEAVDSQGNPLAEPDSGEIAVDYQPEDKQWLPKVESKLELPQGVLKGRGILRFKVKDLIAKQEAKGQIEFDIAGPAPPPAGFAVSKFTFLRSEDSDDPLDVAAYRPGDTVWARFLMTGFALGEKNSYAVSYGVEVLRANGQTLYRQAEAATQTGSTVYPRRFLPGVFSLQLTRDLDRGVYTVILRATDSIGAMTRESRHDFTVE